MDKSAKKIKIAVSSCLAGCNVRYDGKNKKNNIVEQICSIFDCTIICPESGIGLGTPRPPLKLVNLDNTLKARGRTNPAYDVTERLQQYACQIAAHHKDICGYIFKSRSPSCGLDSTPWYTTSGEQAGVTSGIFSSQIQRMFPSLPKIEETQLIEEKIKEEFIEAVLHYAREINSK